jgi:serine/threonine protein kinase
VDPVHPSSHRSRVAMEIIGRGSTANVWRLQGLVAKLRWSPGNDVFSARIKKAFDIERGILEYLSSIGPSPGIIEYVAATGEPSLVCIFLTRVRYYGTCRMKNGDEGLLLMEANCGHLQQYIDREKVSDSLRRTWCLQIANAVAHLHENGVVHMNLSTYNVLLHKTGQEPDAIVADLGLYGDVLPDGPFVDVRLVGAHDPATQKGPVSLPKVDVFSLGAIMYTIMTGHYPFREAPPPTTFQEEIAYYEFVEDLYRKDQFPDVSDVVFGDVIAGCCCDRRYDTAKEVAAAMVAQVEAQPGDTASDV